MPGIRKHSLVTGDDDPPIPCFARDVEALFKELRVLRGQPVDEGNRGLSVCQVIPIELGKDRGQSAPPTRSVRLRRLGQIACLRVHDGGEVVLAVSMWVPSHPSIFAGNGVGQVHACLAEVLCTRPVLKLK